MLLNETQLQMREAAREFAREPLAPGAAARDATHAFPAAELKEMGELGFLGMLVPEEYGGSDTSIVAYAAVLEEIAAGDGPCSTIMSVHSSPRDRLRSSKPLPIAERWIGSVFSPTPSAFRRARTPRLSLRQPQVTQILSNYLLLFQSRTRP